MAIGLTMASARWLGYRAGLTCLYLQISQTFTSPPAIIIRFNLIQSDPFIDRVLILLQLGCERHRPRNNSSREAMTDLSVCVNSTVTFSIFFFLIQRAAQICESGST